MTTCGRDPSGWNNEYSEGADRVRGVLVRRFAISEPHDRGAFRQLSERVFRESHARSDEIEWVRRLGPFAPGLIEHLKRHHRAYDALLFFSLYHPTTVHGLAVAPDRSVLFPYLRLDHALRFGLWTELLSSVRAVGLVSGAERHLLRNYLRVTPLFEEIVGVGIESPPPQTYPRHQQNPADAVTDDEAAGDEEPADTEYLSGRGVLFRRRHRLYGQFALYAGRVEPDNGCEELLEYFSAYAESNGDTALVLMGPKMMKVPDERFVRLAGILSDRERIAAYEAADVTLVPASDDLLVQPLLESFAVGTPVLASARNQAAVEHCHRAGAGLYYAGRGEFVEAIRTLMTDTRLRQKLGECGRRYISQHFRWDAALGRFERLVAHLRRN
jgi:glycosyltransferase involved in cell wall biosynthesis